MSRQYSRKENPTLADLSVIWDSENSIYKLTPLSAIKSLFNLVSTDVAQWITAIWTFIAGIGLTSGRVAHKELTSGSLTAGWNKIAQTTANAADSMSSMFRVTGTDGTFLIEVSFRDSTTAKTHGNTTIEVVSDSSISGTDTYIGGFRLGKSDTVDGAGAVLEVNILIGSAVTVQKIGNSGKSSLLSSWNLVDTPAISTGLCADGTSSATYLAAGESFSITEQYTTGTQTVTKWSNGNMEISGYASFPALSYGTAVSSFYINSSTSAEETWLEPFIAAPTIVSDLFNGGSLGGDTRLVTTKPWISTTTYFRSVAYSTVSTTIDTFISYIAKGTWK